jgi:hypothetical protein
MVEPSQTKLPIILIPLKEREDESDKSLFKNDSLSSYETDQAVQIGAQIFTHLGLPETDQIRKFLRRGELLNTTTLRRLQEDRPINDIARHDRSSASLYKTSRYRDFPVSEDEKQAEIKRLYLSHQKQTAKLHLKKPLCRPSRASQEVQTEQHFAPQER